MPAPVNVVMLPENVSALPWTGERFVPGVHGQVEMEHIHRYVAVMQLCHGKDVLDIASGEGYGCFMLAQVAKSVIGVDIDPQSVKCANEKYRSNKIQFKEGSCHQIPLPDQSLDVVVSFETIEHINEQQSFVNEVKRILRPHGIFIVSTPDRIAATPLDAPPNPYHIRELYRDEFYHLLNKKFKTVQFFGQRSITGSLIFPDGRTAYDKAGEELFFATADKAHRIDCVEFFPRAQNLIAIVTDGTPPAFSSSVYEGIFGTLDILNVEYDALSNQYQALKTDKETKETTLNSLMQAHHQLSESHSFCLKQKEVLQNSLELLEKILQIQKKYIMLHHHVDKILHPSLKIWETQQSLAKRQTQYMDYKEQGLKLDTELNEASNTIKALEPINATLGEAHYVLQGKLSERFVEADNIRIAIHQLFKKHPTKALFIKKAAYSILYRLGLVT